MMKLFVYIFLFFALITMGCSGSTDSEVKIKKTIPQKATSIQDLKGEWTCVKRVKNYNVENTLLTPEADTLVLPGEGNIIFSGDRMLKLDYPREFEYEYFVKVQSNRLLISYTSSDSGYWDTTQFSLSDASLSITYGAPDEVLQTEYYVRDTFDKKTIKLLKTNHINPYELVGNWKLQRQIISQDSEPFDISFSFDLPDSLRFTNNDAKLLESSKNITLIIDGEQRKFTYGFTKNEGSNYNKIWLQPTDWYTGDMVMIHYKSI